MVDIAAKPDHLPCSRMRETARGVGRKRGRYGVRGLTEGLVLPTGS